MSSVPLTAHVVVQRNAFGLSKERFDKLSASGMGRRGSSALPTACYRFVDFSRSRSLSSSSVEEPYSSWYCFGLVAQPKSAGTLPPPRVPEVHSLVW
jgi:hypothetical protein